MNTPKMIFENQDELNEYLNYWKNILFLTDWIIVAKIVEPNDIDEGNVGQNNFNIVNRESVIRILAPKYEDEQAITKYCVEKILIHELLHLKYNILEPQGTYESTFLDVMEHSLLEQMAKSLIMARYGVGLDFFEK